MTSDMVYYAFKASDDLAKYVSLNYFRHLHDIEKAERHQRITISAQQIYKALEYLKSKHTMQTPNLLSTIKLFFLISWDRVS